MDGQLILSIFGVVGTAIAIYQAAVLRESKKRRGELQFLLAGIHQLAVSKQVEWNNQMNLLSRPKDERGMEIFRIHARARDSLMEIASAITALESVIDTDSSAITSMLEKTIRQAELNNRLQTEGLKNPTLPRNQNVDESTSRGSSASEGDDAEANSTGA